MVDKSVFYKKLYSFLHEDYGLELHVDTVKLIKDLKRIVKKHTKYGFKGQDLEFALLAVVFMIKIIKLQKESGTDSELLNLMKAVREKMVKDGDIVDKKN